MARAKKPAGKKPAARKPAARKPPARKPAAKKPAQRPAAAAAPRRAKIKIAVIRQLAAAIEQNAEAPEQVMMLERQLAALPAADRDAAATAVLDHTRKGHPVARAYLRARVALAAGAETSPDADELVRYCATMTRGRRALRPAFLAVWRLATDPAALEAAYRTFAQSELDDPDVLAAGVAAARYLGDAAHLAEREREHARAERLRGLVDELRGAAPARKRGAAAIAALPADDLRHVHRRVVCEPDAFDDAIATAAVLAATDDPATSDMALGAAIVDCRYHGLEAIVAAWKARVAAGDARLVARLVALLVDVARWAGDDDVLEPYVHALYPASGRPEVFAAIHALATGDRAVAREAVFEEWLREVEGQRAFSDEQIDALIRAAIAIAARGDECDDHHAAERALFYCQHAGARFAIADALRTAPIDKNDELRWNLYYGLAHIAHPEVIDIVIERLFVEDDELWALLEVFETRLDAEAHAKVIAALDARATDGGPRAAALYADALIHKNRKPRLLVELARRAAAWPTPADKQDRRRLRYVLEHGIGDALRIRALDDARALLARLPDLPESAYSDYLEVDRKEKTTSELADPDTKRLVAQLEAGELDRQAATARAAAAAARAAGTPVAADDDRLAALAGAQIQRRLVTDGATHEVWFVDDTGAVRRYDGYEIVTAPITEVRIGLGAFINRLGMQSWLAGRDVIHDRFLALVPGGKGGAVREVLRLGDRVLVLDGAGANYWGDTQLEPTGIALADEAAARHLFAILAGNPPDDTVAVDPWYLPGKGAVERKLYVPKVGGGWNSDGDAAVAVVGRQVVSSIDSDVPALILPPDGDAAGNAAAVTAWQGAVLGRRGGVPSKLRINDSYTRREDTLIAAYLDERYRDDSQDAPWHLRGLGEMWQAIVAAGLADQAPDVVIEVGPPASDAEIAAYQALVGEPLPATLCAVWKQVGGGGFRTATRSLRLLSPGELCAQREALRARYRGWLDGRMKGGEKADRLARLDTLDVIAIADGDPLFVFDTAQTNADGRCFASADSTWWESSLGWQIATDLTVVLKAELERRIGDVFRLKLGQRPGPGTRRVRLTKDDRFWEAIVDGTQLLTRTGAKDGPGKPSLKDLASGKAAAAAFDKAVAASRAKGYR